MNTDSIIAVVDYGAGNVQSVVNALDALGIRAELTSDPAAIQRADGIIVPGVGAAQDTIANLERRGLVEPVLDVIARDLPYLGICMGMQALMTSSDENGGQPCLDVVPGVGRRFETTLPVPHMGWNQVTRTRAGAEHPIFDDIPDGADFYFVHSYYCAPADPNWVLAETNYDGRFACVLGRGNLIATQFHPEKSGAFGLRLLANFARIVAAGGVAPTSLARAAV
ncbi:MAG: imidazole glycerol phosphate synthase subunit HisH [Thermomicrobiales bacterium]